MSIVDWISGLFGFGTESMIADTLALDSSCIYSIDDSTLTDYGVNPASGLPMIDGVGGVDVAGNLYGTDFSNDLMSSASFDDSWASGSFSGFGDS